VSRVFLLFFSSLSLTPPLQVSGSEDNAVIAGYVVSQEGKKWSRMWYQVKSDCVLYKFRAHEVRGKIIFHCMQYKKHFEDPLPTMTVLE